TVSSSVGLQALFWGKPLHALGASHLNRFAAAQGVREPDAFTGGNAFDDGNAAWLAFHYSYPDKLAGSPGWLAEVLTRKLEHWRAHGLNGYFDAPLAAPDALTDAMLAETGAALASHWGPPVGTPGRTALDIARTAYFPGGWTNAASSQFGAYRWTNAETAELRLPLTAGREHEIAIEIGTHAGCEGQSAQLRLGERVLAEVAVSTAGPSTLRAVIPAADAAPITALQLVSRRVESPAAGAPRLGLITAKIKVAAQRRPRAPESAPRHSIIIPTLNGEEPLRTILPYMLEVCGDDVEIIVSDNHSEDGTWAYLQSLDAPNLKLVRPPSRLDYGRNAEFGYQHARGEWLSHFGDDDQVTVSRFETIEAVADASRAEMIIGSRLRYYWPSFPSEALANTADPTSFGDTVLLADGPMIGRRMIHSANVRHTPAIVIKRDLVERVRREMSGVFMVQRLGEYVTYRVAAGLAREVACVNRPIAVIGRHTKSIGTSMHHDANAGARYGTDPEREIGSSHGPAGFDFLGQQPFSLEAALIAAEVLAPHIGPVEIDYVVWRQRMLAELNSKVARGVIPQAAAAEIAARGEQALAGAITRQDDVRQPFGVPQALGPRWGWNASLQGKTAGFASINEVATWLENRHFAAQSLAALHYARVEDVKVEWIDG
ncbi:MAG: glycosyltransferase family 2 protein, partial [Caulobacter sp.]